MDFTKLKIEAKTVVKWGFALLTGSVLCYNTFRPTNEKPVIVPQSEVVYPPPQIIMDGKTK